MFLVDWFSFTSKVDSLKTIFDLLGLTKDNIPWQNINGFNGYADRLYFSGISIHYNPHSEDMGIFVDMCGKGCRQFETENFSDIDFFTIFSIICENSIDYNITRLDVAFDDKEGILPITKIANDTRKLNFVSRFSKWGIQETSEGMTVYQGSNKSAIMLRIYDKAAERGVDCHWVRVELQLRQERAGEFVRQYVGGTSIGDMFCGVLVNYCRYVTPSIHDSNKSRWQMRKYWQKLIDNAVKVKLFTSCDLEYNLGNLHNYVIKQAGGAVQTYIDILGVDKLQHDLQERKTPLNPKYRQLIAETLNNDIGELLPNGIYS